MKINLPEIMPSWINPVFSTYVFDNDSQGGILTRLSQD